MAVQASPSRIAAMTPATTSCEIASTVQAAQAATAPRTIVVMRDMTERRVLERQVLDASEQLQRQIGQDLHDGLGQLLTGTAFLAKGLQHSLSSEHQSQAQRIVELINLAIARVRSLARGLSPIHVESRSLEVVLRSTVSEASELLGVSCELELVGMASDGATLAVTSLQRSERRTPVAAELAKAFASSGRPTVLVSADVRSGATDGGPTGVSTFLDGSDDSLEVAPLDENLVWVPAGHTSAAPEALFSTERVSRLLDQARAHGSVVVIDAPRFEDDAEGPLIPGLADVNQPALDLAVTIQRDREENFVLFSHDL